MSRILTFYQLRVLYTSLRLNNITQYQWSVQSYSEVSYKMEVITLTTQMKLGHLQSP